MNYNKVIPNYAYVITVEEFLASCRDGWFIDYDGFGEPIKDNLVDGSYRLNPSEMPHNMPADATHVAWYNR